MIEVGILGASGYMGGEALRVLLRHPQVQIAWATSREGGPAERFHPNLYGTGITFIHPDEATPCDCVFLALPTAPSIDAAARFLDAGSRVIDLGSAFRLNDREIWESAYGQPHSRWDLSEEAVYGIPELHEQEISEARLVANPGCFSSAAILGLAPLLKKRMIDPRTIVVDGLSGTTGAGAELSRAVHHPEIGNNIVPYNVVGHRHTFEVEQELSLVGGEQVTVHFTSAYVPIVRGILDVCHVFPSTEPGTRKDILELYADFYRSQPFVSTSV